MYVGAVCQACWDATPHEYKRRAAPGRRTSSRKSQILAAARKRLSECGMLIEEAPSGSYTTRPTIELASETGYTSAESEELLYSSFDLNDVVNSGIAVSVHMRGGRVPYLKSDWMSPKTPGPSARRRA